jgi:HEAT repeat protein
VLAKLQSLERVVAENPTNTNAIHELIGYSRDRSFITRANAIAILGHFGKHDCQWIRQYVIPVLTEGLKDRDQGVRRTAASAFQELRPSDYETALPQLIAALREGDLDVSCFSAEAIGRMGNAGKAAVPELIKALAGASPGSPHEGPQLRKFAARALGDIGPSANLAIPALKNALNDPNPYFQVEAAAALARIEPTNGSHSTDLANLLNSRAIGVRRSVMKFFKDNPPTNDLVLGAIRKCIDDEDDYVKESATTILEESTGQVSPKRN